MGGGLVPASAILVGGDPGIGKSTLLLQAVAKMAAVLPVLYVTGEESLAQVAGRAHRLELPLEGVNALAETGVESILQHATKSGPRLIVADSVQTLWTETLTAAPGSVSQVRESAARLVRYAKETGTAVFLVGHVTKEGGIAGPRVLEHMVDAVLYFEGESGSRFRLLRAFKNRFGAVNELGVFAMGEKGLKEVPNPSAIFLSGSAQQPGSCVMVTREGTRPLLVEVQALVDATPLSNPRRVAVGRVLVPTEGVDAATRQRIEAFSAQRHARTLAPQGPRRTMFAPDVVGSTAQIIARLQADPLLQQVDELRVELPYELPEQDYRRILTTVIEDIAPALGWRAPAQAA